MKKLISMALISALGACGVQNKQSTSDALDVASPKYNLVKCQHDKEWLTLNVQDVSTPQQKKLLITGEGYGEGKLKLTGTIATHANIFGEPREAVLSLGTGDDAIFVTATNSFTGAISWKEFFMSVQIVNLDGKTSVRLGTLEPEVSHEFEFINCKVSNLDFVKARTKLIR